MSMEALNLEDLNQVIAKQNPEWVRGVLDACNMVNAYSHQRSGDYLVGDSVLAKLNLLKRGKRVRKNPYAPVQA